MDWKILFAQDPRLSGMYQKVRGKPAWPTMTALACGALVVVVPVVLALLAGLVVGVVVYAVASMLASVGEWFGSLGGGGKGSGGGAGASKMPGDEMRENVRVVQRP